MDLDWNTQYLDLEKLLSISKGEKERVFKYLAQFQELIPPRIERLKASMESGDRKMTRQILHQMSPQLQFFGIPDVEKPIRRLEHEYESMPLAELETLVKAILGKLDVATREIERILKESF